MQANCHLSLRLKIGYGVFEDKKIVPVCDEKVQVFMVNNGKVVQIMLIASLGKQGLNIS